MSTYDHGRIEDQRSANEAADTAHSRQIIEPYWGIPFRPGSADRSNVVVAPEILHPYFDRERWPKESILSNQ